MKIPYLYTRKILNAFSRITGNRVGQRLLHYIIMASQYLMGIGAGSDPRHSGEMHILQYLESHSKPPFCVFDVGANMGEYMKLALKVLPADQLGIHCFEPAFHTFSLLEDNLSHKFADIVALNNYALGREPGEATLYYDEPGSGMASLTKRNLSHDNIKFDNYEIVKVDTLTHYCRRKNINKISLLKIDVEGHEMDVLQGATEILTQGIIEIITFEFGGCNIDTGTSLRDFYYFFRKYDMTLHRITPSGYLYPIQSYDWIHEQYRTTNFAAIPNCTRHDQSESVHRPGFQAAAR